MYKNYKVRILVTFSSIQRYEISARIHYVRKLRKLWKLQLFDVREYGPRIKYINFLLVLANNWNVQRDLNNVMENKYAKIDDNYHRLTWNNVVSK